MRLFENGYSMKTWAPCLTTFRAIGTWVLGGVQTSAASTFLPKARPRSVHIWILYFFPIIESRFRSVSQAIISPTERLSKFRIWRSPIEPQPITSIFIGMTSLNFLPSNSFVPLDGSFCSLAHDASNVLWLQPYHGPQCHEHLLFDDSAGGDVHLGEYASSC